MSERTASSYEVIGAIGAGGMGVVYEAKDLRLDRRIALKLLHRHLTLDPQSTERFNREAKLAARVEHPGVVRVYGIGDYEGQVAIELQYIEGAPLNRLMSFGPISVQQAVDLLRQVLDALAACHENGVIHCDLKPGNLLVTPLGQVYLSDFGISRALYSADATATATMSGPLWGTPQYCPPETWDGKEPDAQWDLYALGVLVHEALTGALPFDARTPAVLMREKLEKKTHHRITELRDDLSPQLAQLIDALKATRPEDRPASAEAALEMLRETPEYRDREGSGRRTRPLAFKSDQTRMLALSHTIRAASSSRPAVPPRRLPFWSLAAAWTGAIVLAIAAIAILATGRNRSPQLEEAVTSDTIGKPGQLHNLYIYKGRPYFSYNDGGRGRELWYVADNGRAEMVLDINPGAGSSNPRHFIKRQSSGFVFAATAPGHGEELWRGDCTDHNTHDIAMVMDIIPGPMSGEPMPIATWDIACMFYASTLREGRELWLTNGNANQTALIADISVGAGGSNLGSPRLLTDDTGAYIIAYGTPTGAPHLWRYTYADNSIVPLAEVHADTGVMEVLDGRVYYCSFDNQHGHELWVYDPASGKASLFMDIETGADSSRAAPCQVLKGRLLFRAHRSNHGVELWSTDGTPAGTKLIRDINPGRDDGDPFEFRSTGEVAFFRAKDNAHGPCLWVTDGTDVGTQLACDPWPGSDSTPIYNEVIHGDRIFFSADDGVHGEELWVADIADPISTAHMVEDLWPGKDHAEPHHLCFVDDTIGYFNTSGPHGDRLMRIEIAGESITLSEVKGLSVKK